jgi:hypothetical protein
MPPPYNRGLTTYSGGYQGKRAAQAHQTKNEDKEGSALISVIIAVLFAALVYALCLALGLPAIVGLIAAILVLLAGIPTGGYGIGRRW